MQTDRTKLSGAAGFTLIEIMIAMVILAVGLLGLQALGVTAARMVANGNWSTGATATATQYLEEALREIRVHENSPALRPRSRCESVGGNQVSVLVDMSVPRLPRVTVTVRPTSGQPANRRVILSSYAFYDVPLTGPPQGSACV